MTRSFNTREFDAASPKMIKNTEPWYRQTLVRIALPFHREEGSVAVEFAILGPILAIGLLYLGYLSTKIHRYITMEQIARAGVEAAISDPGPQVVLNTMRAAAVAKGYTAWTPDDEEPRPEDALVLDAGRNCTCPEDMIPSLCTNLCPTGRPMFVRYFLSVQQDFTSQDVGYFEGLITLGLAPFIDETFIRKSVLVR